jgi:hypothetical protein
MAAATVSNRTLSSIWHLNMSSTSKNGFNFCRTKHSNFKKSKSPSFAFGASGAETLLDAECFVVPGFHSD